MNKHFAAKANVMGIQRPSRIRNPRLAARMRMPIQHRRC